MGSHDELAEKRESRSWRRDFAPAKVNSGAMGCVVVCHDRRQSSPTMDDMDRQEAIWNLLGEKLTSEEQQVAVSIVVALTPREKAVHSRPAAFEGPTMT